MQFDQLKRREFITLLGGTAAAWSLAARAQQSGRMYRLGFLMPSGRKTPWVLAFLDELRLNGFIEGQNLAIIPGGFDAQVDLLAERAEAMVKATPDAIVGGPELQLRALQSATRTIPLIGMTNDMVADGLVKSLARPGGNTTGISLLSPQLDGKRQDILIEAVPGARRMAALSDSNVTSEQHHSDASGCGKLARDRTVVFSELPNPKTSHQPLTPRRRRARKHSISWHHRYFFLLTATTSRALRQRGCPRFTTGPKRRRRAVSWLTGRVSRRSGVSARDSPSRYSVETNPPTFRSSNRPILSWSSIFRQRRQSATRRRLGSFCAPTR
jgi:hypothetical protein